MRVIDIEIGKCNFSVAQCYRIVVQGKHKTEFSDVTERPSFEQSYFQCPLGNGTIDGGGTECITISIQRLPLDGSVDENDGNGDSMRGDSKENHHTAETVATQRVELQVSKEPLKKTVTFSVELNPQSGLSDFTGSIEFTYKIHQKLILESLHSMSNTFCFSVNAAYVSSSSSTTAGSGTGAGPSSWHAEKPFDIKIRLRSPENKVLGAVRLSNKSHHSYLDIDSVLVLGKSIDAIITELGKDVATVRLKFGVPVNISIPSPSGDPILLMMQLVAGKKRIATGVVHSATMKETTWLESPRRRMSLVSPRSSGDTGSANGSPREDKSPAACNPNSRSLLFLEYAVSDSTASTAAGTATASALGEGEAKSALSADKPAATSAGQLLGSIASISSVLRGIAPSPCLNNQSSPSHTTSAASAGGDGGGGVLDNFTAVMSQVGGPVGTVYVVCVTKGASATAVDESPAAGFHDSSEGTGSGSEPGALQGQGSSKDAAKPLRKQLLQGINLGLLKLSPQNLKNPLKLHASLLDITYKDLKIGRPTVVGSGGSRRVSREQVSVEPTVPEDAVVSSGSAAATAAVADGGQQSDVDLAADAHSTVAAKDPAGKGSGMGASAGAGERKQENPEETAAAAVLRPTASHDEIIADSRRIEVMTAKKREADNVLQSEVEQSVLCSFSGLLEETSRESYNDTGVISCTLEGKLLRYPQQAEDSSKTAAGSARGSRASAGSVDPLEPCMAVQVYLSIVPSSSTDESPEDENTDLDHDQQDEEEGKTKRVEEEVSKGEQRGKETERVTEIAATTADSEIEKERNKEQTGKDLEKVGRKRGDAAPAPAADALSDDQRNKEEKEGSEDDDDDNDGEGDEDSILGEVKKWKRNRESADIERVLRATNTDINNNKNEVEAESFPDKSGVAHTIAEQEIVQGDKEERNDGENLRDALDDDRDGGCGDFIIGGGVGDDFGKFKANMPQNDDELDAASTFNTPLQPVKPEELRKHSSKPEQDGKMEQKAEEKGEGGTYGVLPAGKVSSAFGEKLDPRGKFGVPKMRENQLDTSESKGKGGKKGPGLGVAFAEVVRAELVEKQRVIEKLLDEIRGKDKAIQVVGRDIRQLREERIVMEADLKQAKNQAKALEDRERHSAKLTESLLSSIANNTKKGGNSGKSSGIGRDAADNVQYEFDGMDREGLVQLLSQSTTRLVAAERDKKRVLETLGTAREALVQYSALKKEHRTLQEAHLQQTQQLQTLRPHIEQMDAYRQTIQAQEGVIAKLQHVVESKFRSKHASAAAAAAASIVAAKSASTGAGSHLPAHAAGFFEKTRLEEELEATKQALAARGTELSTAQSNVNHMQEKIASLESELHAANVNLKAHRLKRRKLLGEADSASDSDSNSESDVEGGSELEKSKGGKGMENKADGRVAGVGRRKQVSDLKSAKKMIDQLEAESVAKEYRVSALESQLEASARESSREIARLRTKLFELEMAAAADDADDDDEDARLREGKREGKEGDSQLLFEMGDVFDFIGSNDSELDGERGNRDGERKKPGNVPSGSAASAVNALRNRGLSRSRSRGDGDVHSINASGDAEKGGREGRKEGDRESELSAESDLLPAPVTERKENQGESAEERGANEEGDKKPSAQDGASVLPPPRPQSKSDPRNDEAVVDTFNADGSEGNVVNASEKSEERIEINESRKEKEKENDEKEKEADVKHSESDMGKDELRRDEEGKENDEADDKNSENIGKISAIGIQKLLPPEKSLERTIDIVDSSGDVPVHCGSMNITFHIQREIDDGSDIDNHGDGMAATAAAAAGNENQSKSVQGVFRYAISKVKFTNSRKIDTKDHYEPFIAFQIGGSLDEDAAAATGASDSSSSSRNAQSSTRLAIWKAQTNPISDAGLTCVWEFQTSWLAAPSVELVEEEGENGGQRDGAAIRRGSSGTGEAAAAERGNLEAELGLRAKTPITPARFKTTRQMAFSLSEEQLAKHPTMHCTVFDQNSEQAMILGTGEVSLSLE